MCEHEDGFHDAPAEEHEELMHRCLDIAAVCVSKGYHRTAFVALLDAGEHYAEWCYLQNKAAAIADGLPDHEPIRPATGPFVKRMLRLTHQLAEPELSRKKV